jgi:hypothetical protein
MWKPSSKKKYEKSSEKIIFEKFCDCEDKFGFLIVNIKGSGPVFTILLFLHNLRTDPIS